MPRVRVRSVRIRESVGTPARESRPQPTPRSPAGLTNTQKAVGISVGLGLVGLARWFAAGRKLIEDAATRQDVGELK